MTALELRSYTSGLGTAASAREAHEVGVLGKEGATIRRSCRRGLHQTYLPTWAALSAKRYFGSVFVLTINEI